eukprot:2534939-Prymnesium_polylepis.1
MLWLSWGEELALPLTEEDEVVHVVLHEQHLFNYEIIGHAVVPLSELSRGAHAGGSRWVKLRPKEGDSADRQLGELRVELVVRTHPGKLKAKMMRANRTRMLSRPILPNVSVADSYERELGALVARQSSLGFIGGDSS